MNKRINNARGRGSKNVAGSRIKKKAVSRAVMKEMRIRRRAAIAERETARMKAAHVEKPPKKHGFFRSLFNRRGK